MKKAILTISLAAFLCGCGLTDGGSGTGGGNVGQQLFAAISCTTSLECQDGIWCNGIEYCGCVGEDCHKCLPGFQANCEDNNPCTVDNCINDTIGTPGSEGVDGEIGEGHCEHLPICEFCRDSYDCDDHDVCTTDICIASRCQHDPEDCNDGNICTMDTCDPEDGCMNELVEDCCNSDLDCDDGVHCTADTCNPSSHSCEFDVVVGMECEYTTNECYDPGMCRPDGLCGPGPLHAPANDTCDDAIEITLSDIGEACVEGDTSCAAHDYSSSCGGGGEPDLAYTFSFDVGSEYQLYSYDATLKADFDTILYAQGSCGNVVSQIECNDNCMAHDVIDCDEYGLGLLESAVKIPPYAVGTHRNIALIVDGRGGERGWFQLQLHKVLHKNNPCHYAYDDGRRVDATYGGQFRGNINGYINDMIGASQWNYFKWITLNPAAPMDDYQVKVQLTTSSFNYGHAKADGGDLRFYDSSGSSLSYWIESWNPAGTSIIWVKVRSSGTSRIRMDYGNASVSSLSNGEATFDFFDDFPGSALDATKWNTAGHSGYPGMLYTVGGGRLEAWSDGRWRILTMKKDLSPGQSIIVEGRLQETTASWWHAFYFARNTNANNQRLGVYDRGGSNWQVQQNVNGAYTNPASFGGLSYGTWLKMRLKKKSATIMEIARLNDDRSLVARYETNQGAWGGITWTWVTWKLNSTRSYYDWILARKYASTEPAAIVGTEETGSSLTWQKTPCHAGESANSDWPAYAWFVLNPPLNTTYCIETDEQTPDGWFDTVISAWDNTYPTGCTGFKLYQNCAHLDGRDGASNPTRLEVTVPGNAVFMVGISSYGRPTAGNYKVHFNTYPCAAVERNPTSCQDLHEMRPSDPSGFYLIDPDGSSGRDPFYVYCDMQTAGGGWTLVASYANNAYGWAQSSSCNALYGGNCTTAAQQAAADALRTTMRNRFRTTSTYNSISDIGARDVILQSYSTVPFTKMMLQSPAPASCATMGGIQSGSSCYRQFTSPLLWLAARNACVSWGGHLVTIANAVENEFVRANFAAVTGDAPWIGFNDIAVEGTFAWVTGEPVTYTSWNGGEPNNVANEDYVHMYSNGRWNDCRDACGARSYVCEYDSSSKQYIAYDIAADSVAAFYNGNLYAGANALDFDNYTIQSYGGGGQDINPANYATQDDGYTLRMWGNNWKAIAYTYNVTSRTMLEFDFKSDGAEGEINGVALDEDLAITPERLFKVYGTQSWGFLDYDNYSGSSWKHYIIPVGRYYTGTMRYIGFSNDADAGQATSVYFRNVRVHEGSVMTWSPSSTNVSTAVNRCGNLNIAFIQEDSDSGYYDMWHSFSAGPMWQSVSNNTCPYDDIAGRWSTRKLGGQDATTSSHLLWFVK